jgi:ATP dependent DNA ligase domain
VHEIKFDGYRVQLRVDNGSVTLKTRKGLDWTGKFPEIAGAAKRLPSCIVDGEIVALDHNGSGLCRAAGRAVGWQDQRPDLLCLRPSICGGWGRPARGTAGRAQGATGGHVAREFSKA